MVWIMTLGTGGPRGHTAAPPEREEDRHRRPEKEGLATAQAPSAEPTRRDVFCGHSGAGGGSRTGRRPLGLRPVIFGLCFRLLVFLDSCASPLQVSAGRLRPLFAFLAR